MTLEAPAAAVQGTPAPEAADAPAAAPAAAETTTQPPQVSPQLAAIARREKAVREQLAAIEAQKAELEAARAKYETEYVPRSALKSDYMKLLNEAGVTYDDIVANLLNTTPQTPEAKQIAELQAQIEALKSTTQQSVTKFEEFQTTQYKAALDAIREQATGEIEANAADYELIKATNSVDAVVELIKRTHEEEGRVMSTKEALKLVEEHLLEETLKVAQAAKIKAKLLPPTAPEAAAPAAQAASPAAQVVKQSQQQTPFSIKTLTNAQTVTNPARLSEQQRRERAIAAFKGQLAQ